jgi:5'-deoxynucleotidase YfbR-like HD superfamily hydrolase
MAATEAVIKLGRLALAFGRVDRITFHEDGTTPESDTDHTVMLGLTACALAYGTDLNEGLVAQYALVHDLVEVYAGDTATLRALSDEAKADKKAREQAAQDRIVREFVDTLPWVTVLLCSYERQIIREARFVRAVDKLLPKVAHIANGCATLRAQGVGVAELAARYELQERELREYAAEFPIVFELRHDLVGRVLEMYGAHFASPTLSRCGPDEDDEAELDVAELYRSMAAAGLRVASGPGPLRDVLPDAITKMSGRPLTPGSGAPP